MRQTSRSGSLLNSLRANYLFHGSLLDCTPGFIAFPTHISLTDAQNHWKTLQKHCKNFAWLHTRFIVFPNLSRWCWHTCASNGLLFSFTQYGKGVCLSVCLASSLSSSFFLLRFVSCLPCRLHCRHYQFTMHILQVWRHFLSHIWLRS